MPIWAERLVECLKESQISLVTYVPDINIHQATRLVSADPYFHLVSASREEEAIGIAAGGYSAGRNSAVFMQSSGFGNCLNAVGSLCLPHRIPLPFFINLRGGVGEFNIAQVPLGRGTKPILDVLGIPHFTLTNEDEVEPVVNGAIKLCYASRSPVGICLTAQLHGGKSA
jgi:sulfopyruvate decarboxylase alpha subunit